VVILRRWIPLLVFAILGTTVSTGCFVGTRPRGETVVRERRSCPPAHHWEGNDCVHNGHGRDKDHDRH